MSLYYRMSNLIVSSSEFERRYREAWLASRTRRQELREKALNSDTYYDAAVSEHKLGEMSKEPWRDMLSWAEGEPGLSASEIASVRAMAKASLPPDPDDFKGHFDDDVAEFYLDTGDIERLTPILDANDIEYGTHEFPTGKSVMTIDMGSDGPWVVELGAEPSYWQDVHDWLSDAVDRWEEFYGERDESAEFWDGVGAGVYLYHATDKDNLAGILATGLEARDDTRGLSNRDIGPAVFAVTGENDLSALESYGEAVVRIDLAAMKRDGYTPDITGETPVQEADTAESLANAIGYEYEADRASDYMDDTVAILGNVPAKYLSVA